MYTAQHVTFPTNAPSCTVTPIAPCTGAEVPNDFITLTLMQVDEVVYTSGQVVGDPVQTVDFTKGEYDVQFPTGTNKSVVQSFNFSRNLAMTTFDFMFLLSGQPQNISYLGYIYKLAPSAVKFTLTITNWNWISS